MAISRLLIDAETSVLRGLVVGLDQQLEGICRKSVESNEDSDAFGYFDSAEHLTGLGFVACQTYMAIVYGHLHIDKPTALKAGPVHSGGQTKLQIINHAANYWKHNNEWQLDRSPKRRERIEAAFESVGFPVGTDYPLSGVLTEIASPAPAGFLPVIRLLEVWKAELCTAA